jgi:hypothetical protein
MSYKTALFVIVEGKQHDRYFVDKICRSSTKVAAEGYEIIQADQIRRGRGVTSGGKTAVLAFYDYCRRVHKLIQENSGGRRSICFFVDRDTQEITGGRRRSPHVIYTVLADTEAHIFANSDEAEAIANAASLDLATAHDVVKSIGDWQRDLADVWRPWIEECYVAAAVNASCWVGFGHESRIHTGSRLRTLNANALANARQAIQSSSRMTGAEFLERRRLILLRIERIYQSGRQSTLLKGKWLPRNITFAVDHYFRSIGWPDGWNNNSFNASVARCYLAHLDTSAAEIVHLRNRLEVVAS